VAFAERTRYVTQTPVRMTGILWRRRLRYLISLQTSGGLCLGRSKNHAGSRDCAWGLHFFDAAPDLSPSEVRNGLTRKACPGTAASTTSSNGAPSLRVLARVQVGNSLANSRSQTTQFTPAKQEKLDALVQAPFFDRRAHLEGLRLLMPIQISSCAAELLDPIFVFSKSCEHPRFEYLACERATVAPVDGLNLSIAATYLGLKVTSPFFTYNSARRLWKHQRANSLTRG